MHWEGGEDSGDRATASQFPEARSTWNWQLPANFRMMRVEGGEGGSGSFDFGVSQEGLVAIRQSWQKWARGLAPDPIQEQTFKSACRDAGGGDSRFLNGREGVSLVQQLSE